MSDFKVYGSLKKYTLNDFAEYTQKNKYKQIIDAEETCFSRHIRLFNVLRYFGYSIAKESVDYCSLHSKLQEYANSINNSFERQIKIKYIVNSVTEFCWEHRFDFSQKKWNWNGYTKQDNDITFENRSKRETLRRRKEMLNKSPLNLEKFLS
mgnify:CR=1 FL=1